MTNSLSTYVLGPQPKYGRPDRKGQAMVAAQRLYQQARSRSWFDKVRSALSGHPRRLPDLGQVLANCKGLGQRSLGTQIVPISQIRGSTNGGRCRDFDADFRPLKTHNQARWLGVASAWQQRVKLPPVVLVQVGSFYFVEDGHHRLSVAKALGQTQIEAVVTVWKATGPLPWQETEEETQPRALTGFVPQSA
jgi:hypothetical protein